MTGNKYISNASGTLTEVVASQTSAGAGDAGKIPALNSAGQIDLTMMPTGVGPDTAIVTASEILAAGASVNIWNSSGAFKVRNADASTSGKEAHGFVLSGFASAASAVVYFAGPNTSATGLTPGPQFLSDTTPGGVTATAPVGSGKTVQRVGIATSATSLNFEANDPITLA